MLFTVIAIRCWYLQEAHANYMETLNCQIIGLVNGTSSDSALKAAAISGLLSL